MFNFTLVLIADAMITLLPKRAPLALRRKIVLHSVRLRKRSRGEWTRGW